MKKNCPLLGTICLEEDCQWWIDDCGDCVFAQIAHHLTAGKFEGDVNEPISAVVETDLWFNVDDFNEEQD